MLDRIARCAALVLAGALSAHVHADVRVVDAAGGAPFTTIQAAVNAASDGDVILVKPGVYTGFVVNDKALDFIADPTAVVIGNSMILNLAATRAVTLSGLQIQCHNFTAPLTLQSNSGSVRVQDCEIRAEPTATATGWSVGMNVTSSQDVAIVRGLIRGTHGTHGMDGARALVAAGSRIAIHDCSIWGGSGGSDIPTPSDPYAYGGYGGEGIDGSTNTFLYSAGSHIRGGDGGIGYGGAATDGDGAVSLFHAVATRRLLGNLLINGSPPPSPPTPTNNLAGTARHMTGTARARENQSVQLEFTGAPGEEVLLLVGEREKFTYLDPSRGVQLVRTHTPRSAPNPVQLVGTIGASGTLTTSWTVLDLGAGVQSRRQIVQPVFRASSGTEILGPPLTIVLLDAAF